MREQGDRTLDIDHGVALDANRVIPVREPAARTGRAG